jgi:hypothetical protein
VRQARRRGEAGDRLGEMLTFHHLSISSLEHFIT